MDKNSIERLLADTQAPCVRDGDHRARLKARLVQAMQRKETAMIRWQKRAAWAFGIMLVLVVTVYAAQKILQYRIQENVQESEKVIENPDGTKSYEKRSTTTFDGVVNDKDLDHVESARLARECMRRIRAGDATLIKVEDRKGGGKYYIYKVKFDNKEVEYRSTDDILNKPLPEYLVKDMVKSKNGNLVQLLWAVKRDGTVAGPIGSGSGTKWETDPLHELPELIEQGKGREVEARKVKDGQMYIYEFTLSNGEKVKYGSLNKPLKTK